jgi:lipoprotein-anchoring transpeptidase ErfK/SrfK
MALMLLAGKARAAERTAASEDNPGATPVRRIVISLTDRKLAVLEDGVVLKIYDTAVGAPKSPSPVGIYQVLNRVALPTYYTSGKVIPPGKKNPLGTRWIGLSLKGFGIHGTNVPKSIGRAASHGCIRLRNDDVEELFERVRPGDVVEFHAQRNEELMHIFAPGPKAPPKQVSQTAAVGESTVR